MILVTLIGAELVLRLFIKLPDPYQHLRSQKYSTGSVIRLQNTRNTDLAFVFNPNELFPKDEKNIINIHINNQGFRHHEDVDTSRNEFSIFAIGGSTTQGYDYAYEKTWCQVLEKDLEASLKSPINVYNGGTAGAAMFDHIALLQNRTIHLQPDMVILFAGVNDLNLLLGDDNIYRFDDVFETQESISWYKLGLARFTLYKLFLNAKRRVHANEDSPLFRKADENDTTIPEGTPVQFADHKAPPIETEALPLGKNPVLDYDYYSRMVRSFIATCKVNNIPVVVMTQPTTWKSSDERLQKYHWMHKNRENKFSKEFMQNSMDLMNNNVQQICENQKVPLLRIEKLIPNNGEYFYDDCHFTPKGSVFVGNTLAEFIKENNLIKID